jgi:hypothetical protein
MPLLADTAWPPHLLRLFDICHSQPQLNNCYNGPYNMLLHYCVERVGDPCLDPFLSHFLIYPLFKCGFSACNVDDYMFSFIAEALHGPPVDIVDIRDESWAHSAYSQSGSPDAPAVRFHT